MPRRRLGGVGEPVEVAFGIGLCSDLEEGILELMDVIVGWELEGWELEAVVRAFGRGRALQSSAGRVGS